MAAPGPISSYRKGINSFIESVKSPSILLPNMTAAIVLSTMNIAVAISIGALVFSDQLSLHLAKGIGLFLVAMAVGGVLVPAGSNYKAIISGPRSGQAPIFAAMAAAVAAAMPNALPQATAATVVASILTATIITGLVMFLLGWARLGTLVRFIPFPVMGGFFAGLGYLLFSGGVSVSLGPIASSPFPVALFTAQALPHAATALIFAVVLNVSEKRITHWLFMPVFLAISIALFYVVLLISGYSFETAVANHWLPMVSGGDQAFFPVITLDQFILVDWSVVTAQASTYMVLAFLSVIMLLLDVSGVEIIINRELEPNAELRSTGLANVVGGMIGSPLAFAAAADTGFVHKLGGDRFVMILIYGAILVGAIVIGPGPIAYVPSSVLGGLLMYIGISFLVEWVWRAYRRLPLMDYLVILVILLVIAGFGILEGVGVGSALAMVLFVHRYSQLSNIKTEMGGGEHCSHVDRSKANQKILDRYSDNIRILSLQGFLFFGSASRLLSQIKETLERQEMENMSYLILDFRRVDAMDSSAVNSFAKLMQIAWQKKLILVITASSPEITELLKKQSKLLSMPSDSVQYFNNIDTGRGWCDDQILLHHSNAAPNVAMDPIALLETLLGDHEAALVISDYFKKISVPSGEILFEQGDTSDALYLILKGTVSINLRLSQDREHTVRIMRRGAVLGEMGLYSGSPRSAAARVAKDSVLYRLNLKAWRNMQDKHPAQAGIFQTYIINLLSERLGRANKEILALTR